MTIVALPRVGALPDSGPLAREARAEGGRQAIGESAGVGEVLDLTRFIEPLVGSGLPR